MTLFTYNSLLKYISDNNIDVRDRVNNYPKIRDYVFYGVEEISKRLNDKNLKDNLIEVKFRNTFPKEVLFEPSMKYIMIKNKIIGGKELYVSYNDQFSYESCDGINWNRCDINPIFKPGIRYDVIDFYKDTVDGEIVYKRKDLNTNPHVLLFLIQSRISSTTVLDVLSDINLLKINMNNATFKYCFRNGIYDVRHKSNKSIEYSVGYSRDFKVYSDICRKNNVDLIPKYRYINNVIYELDNCNYLYKTYIFKDLRNRIDDLDILLMKSKSKQEGVLVK